MRHLRETGCDAAIVCDTGVNGDDVIATMLATGLWRLSDRVETVEGKRIRTLEPISRDTPLDTLCAP